MFERFATDARHTVVRAQVEAARLRHGYIGKEHLLLALAREGGTIAGEVLRDVGVTPEAVDREIRRIVGRGPSPAFGAEDEEALEAMGIDVREVRRAVERAFGPGALDRAHGPSRPRRRPGVLAAFCLTPKSKQSLQLALREARHLGHGAIGSEHLLLGLIRSEGGVGAAVLSALGAEPCDIRTRVLERLAKAS